MENKSMYYSDYLGLDKILDAQHPESFKKGNEPAHDEMLFIIVHQAYELWFKQIIFELDYIVSVFKKEKIDDNSEDLNLVRHRLNRIIQILTLLNQQVSLIETMTPLDFLEFRNLLKPSSGFQSLQFRIVESKLGLNMNSRYEKEYYSKASEGGLQPEDLLQLKQSEKETNLLHLVNNWLERMPFFEEVYWKPYNGNAGNNDVHIFWDEYRKIYEQGLTEKEKDRIIDFDRVLFEKNYEHMTEPKPETLLSAAALRSALFIMLYRDFPVFQTSYQILDSLVEIDHLMAGWRHRHLIMVRRMIGMRVGTGNTSGAGYLQGALNSHFVFKDIEALSTFLIERKKLPKLPMALIRKLSYN
ncbi:MAG: tryptophan 2,3-dioxygenase family protein [Ginsengibacter sp.]